MAEERCNICYLRIQDQATHLLCPRCLNSFHRDHLAAWLLNDKKCPVCKEILSDAFREELKPKSERERRKLQALLRTLDGLGDVLGDWEDSKENKKRLKEMRQLSDEDAPSILRLVLPIVFSLFWIVILIAAFA